VTSNVAILDVTTDTPPTAEIASPAAGATYRAGDMISFSGSGLDLEDGILGTAAMTWQVDFHHDTHSHPFLPSTSGIGMGQVTVPTHSETSANVWFRIRLTVTDSAGLSTSVFRDVLPVTSDFSVATNIDGAQILVDGQTTTTPQQITGVVNVARTLEAPESVSGDGKLGRFVQWLDGQTSRFREIATPEQGTAYLALYEDRLSSSLVYLSDLGPSNAPPPNGWGPIELDTSNGEAAAGDGNPMRTGGVGYEKGLGVHANSDVRYALGAAFNRFIADVGVDDESGNNGSVVFQVYGDGNLLFTSNTRTGNDASTGQPLRADVNVTGINELRLVVTDAGNGNASDHANWANARLVPAATGNRVYINFQPSGSPTPPGYVADTGQVYGDRGGGMSYGWSVSHAASMFDRNATTADDLYETHVYVQANQNWEIAVPNGTYAVTVAVGDAGGNDNDTINTVNVEGVSYWNAMPLQNDNFAQATRLVTVADGRLTLDAGSSSSSAVNFIEIIPVPIAETQQLFPLFVADVNLDGKLTLNDALDFAAGWGTHIPSLNVEQRVRLGDLDFDGDTDNDDWNVFNLRWTQEHGMPLSLPALLTPVAGDFDRNGIVAEPDYVLWRSTFGSTVERAADGNGNGVVDAADYVLWRERLGQTIAVAAFDDRRLTPDPMTELSDHAVPNSPGVSDTPSKEAGHEERIRTGTEPLAVPVSALAAWLNRPPHGSDEIRETYAGIAPQPGRQKATEALLLLHVGDRGRAVSVQVDGQRTAVDAAMDELGADARELDLLAISASNKESNCAAAITDSCRGDD
jgi:hypothetical protein